MIIYIHYIIYIHIISGRPYWGGLKYFLCSIFLSPCS